jgi:hypothetical protein
MLARWFDRFVRRASTSSGSRRNRGHSGRLRPSFGVLEDQCLLSNGLVLFTSDRDGNNATYAMSPDGSGRILWPRALFCVQSCH